MRLIYIETDLWLIIILTTVEDTTLCVTLGVQLNVSAFVLNG